MNHPAHDSVRLRIAIVGSGIAGLSAAWLLSQRHAVTLFESNHTLGGHANTVEVIDGRAVLPVDTGFIVYNETNYPNLVALFAALAVPSAPSDMSFSASLRDGELEYAGTNLAGLLAQPRNLLRPRFWRMLNDLRRFYRQAPSYLENTRDEMTLGALLRAHGYSRAFCQDHLLPMAAAIWSASTHEMEHIPARTFIDFFNNHGLLRLTGRPQWRTVLGGAREYVQRLRAAMPGAAVIHQRVRRIERASTHALLETADGALHRFDHVVVATHADQALRLLGTPSTAEHQILGAFRYAQNDAVLHEDCALMPRRRAAWASWNYLERGTGSNDRAVSVTYWMNRLQPLATTREIFVSLNPTHPPSAELTHYQTRYAHPQFDRRTQLAQRLLWQLQGQHRTWFCGSYFGAGFHEDALQAGLWVAEQLGGAARPWSLPTAPSRIGLPPPEWRVPLSVAA